METRDGKIPLLLVQPWTHDSGPIRDALAAAGIDASITRVDFEAALHAALSTLRYALVIYDPATRTVSNTVVVDCIRSCQRDTPVVVVDDLRALGDLARAALHARSS